MASVYKKRDGYYMRVKGPDGIWRDRPCEASTKPAAQLEALAAQQLADRQRDGLAPSPTNSRRTFGELMDLHLERFAPRLRSQSWEPFVEKHLRPALGRMTLGAAASALGPLLNGKVNELSPSSLNHLRAYVRRLFAIASMRNLGWWIGANPINQLELPKFKEPKRRRPTIAAEDVPAILAVLDPNWRPLFATAFFLGLRRGELIALQKQDIDLREGLINVCRSGDADQTKGGHDDAIPIPPPLVPYLEAAIALSPSEWVFPKPDGSMRATDIDLTAVLRRALGRAGIVAGYEHRCRKSSCGHSERAADRANRTCPKDGRNLWPRALPLQGLTFHSVRHTTCTLLAKAKVHPKVAQKILRHADIETTMDIYTHVGGIEDMREAVGKLDFGALADRAPHR